MESLRISHLSKAYDGRPVLEDVSLTFEPGTVTALCAPSGRGKTTLLRILAGLEKPDAGEISGLPDKKPTAYLFQESRLFDALTALENVMLVLHGKKKETRLRALSLLESLGITSEDAEKYPHALSGGMRRRVAAARMLAFAEENDTPLVLLDEPFQGLDEERKHAVITVFMKALAGRTVIFVTHEEAEVEAYAKGRRISL